MTAKLTTNIFTPSASVSPIAPSTGGSVSLPAVDGSNPALTVTNNTGGAIYYVIQATAFNPYASNPGSGGVLIQPGMTHLYAASGPADFTNAVSATAPFAAVLAPAGGGLVFARGSVTTQTAFQ